MLFDAVGPYNHTQNVLSASLNKTFPSFHYLCFPGSFLHLPTPSGDACPANSMPFDAIGWSFLNTDRVFDTSERKLRLSYSTKYVHVDKNELRIKVMRSPGEDLMLSGAYYRHADMLKGGKYEVRS